MKRIISALILLLSIAVSAQVTVTPYGHAQYRLRFRYTIQTPDAGDNLTTKEYCNQIAYHAGLRAQLSETMSFQFQIGNDWVATEDVDWEANEAWLKRKGLYPYFHLAYFNWNPGQFYLMGGILPVQSHGALDLLERSLNNDTYASAALVGWAVGTNASSMGLKVGMPLLKDDFSLGVDLFSTVISSRPQTIGKDTPDALTAVMFVVDVPMRMAKFSITPQASVIFNRLYNPNTDEADHEYAGGFSARYAFTKKLNLTTKFGYAQLNNENTNLCRASEDDFQIIDTTGRVVSDPVGEQYNEGLIAGLGGSVVAGPGSFIFEATYNYNNDDAQDNAMEHYIFSDLKYGWGVNDNFTLMPRVRTFTTIFAEQKDDESRTEIRPEILFIARF